MNERYALSRLVCSDGGDKRGNAGADILTEQKRQRHGVCDLTRGNGDGLQNTDGSRRGLKHSRQDSSRDNAEHGVREHHQNIAECLVLSKTRSCGGHRVHAEHQYGETREDHADGLFLVRLGEHN